MTEVSPTRRIRFIEVDNESSYDGSIYVVKEGVSTPYKVGLSPAHKCLRWDLKEVQGLHNGDEVHVRIASDQASATDKNSITVDTSLNNVAQYLVHGQENAPDVDFQGMPMFPPPERYSFTIDLHDE